MADDDKFLPQLPVARLKTGVGDKRCFVVSPFGNPRSEVRVRADGILNEIIRPALEALGYRVERADEDASPGVVTERMIEKILEADLVVADLTGHNPNVMYEVAVRHAQGGAIVQMIEEGQALPFDIKDFSTIFFRATLEGRSEAVSRLQNAAQSVLSGAEVRNPVSRAVQMRILQQGSKPESEIVADALKEIRDLAAEMRSITARGQHHANFDSAGREALRRELLGMLKAHARLSTARSLVENTDPMVFYNEPDDWFYFIVHCWDASGNAYLAATSAPGAAVHAFMENVGNLLADSIEHYVSLRGAGPLQ